MKRFKGFSISEIMKKVNYEGKKKIVIKNLKGFKKELKKLKGDTIAFYEANEKELKIVFVSGTVIVIVYSTIGNVLSVLAIFAMLTAYLTALFGFSYGASKIIVNTIYSKMSKKGNK